MLRAGILVLLSKTILNLFRFMHITNSKQQMWCLKREIDVFEHETDHEMKMSSYMYNKGLGKVQKRGRGIPLEDFNDRVIFG